MAAREFHIKTSISHNYEFFYLLCECPDGKNEKDFAKTEISFKKEVGEVSGYSRENLIDNIYSYESYIPGDIWAATVDFALKNNGARSIDDLTDSAIEALFNDLFDKEADLK